ncbi:MAG: radical SAM protein [Bacteroidetes bacterium]|nr:radical SAM protein [Bacteroidota bacterium]
MKDLLRLILFTECNLSCSYCCNENPAVNSKFEKKLLHEINFLEYKNICLTGGEPFLNFEILLEVLLEIPKGIPVYIYTNGLLINENYCDILSDFCNIGALNVGLHHVNQIKSINPIIDEVFNVRYLIQDIRRDEFIRENPSRLNSINTKTWTLDACEMPNEDWVLLDNGGIKC